MIYEHFVCFDRLFDTVGAGCTTGVYSGHTLRRIPSAKTMNRISYKTLSVGLIALACLVVPARAEVVLSNLTESGVDYAPLSSGLWFGVSFVTNNQAWTLTSATLSFDTAENTSGNLFVNLYSNATNSPGSSLGTLSGSDNPASAGQYTYTTNGINLDPSTTYWLVAGVSSGSGVYRWLYTDPTTSTGVWSIPSTNTYAYNETGVGTTGYRPTEGLGTTGYRPTEGLGTSGSSTWSSHPGTPQLFSIEATAVPEPSTYAMALAGLACGGYSVFRRRKRA